MLILALIVVSSAIAVTPDIGAYFVPVNASLFERWRQEKLSHVPSLLELTDSSGRYSREEIESALLPVFLPRSVPSTLEAFVIDEGMREPVRRAIYSLVILSDLNMVRSNLNPWKFIGDLHTRGELTDRMLALTFVMMMPSCTIVWQSLKEIAIQHGVHVVQLAHHVADIGAFEGTKWFLTTLRQREKRIDYVATF
jgi:hypothetical protein